jgi:predicted dehydrogenase
MRIGIVGAGEIGRIHAACLASINQVTRLHYFDVRSERATALADQFGGRVERTFSDLVATVDALWLCTPPHLHRQDVEIALRAGVAVLCEKPIALTLEDADAMARAEEGGQAPLTIGHVGRYAQGVRAIRRVFQSGQIGKMLWCWEHRHTSSLVDPMPAWRLDPGRGGGFVVEWQIHAIDTLRWLGGDVLRVFGRIGFGLTSHPTFDTHLHALLEFSSGATGAIEGSLITAHAPGRRWGIVGDAGTVVARQGGSVEIWRGEQRVHVAELESEVDPRLGLPAAFLDEDRDFLGAVQRGTPPAVRASDGRAALAVALALHESARLGQVVILP